MISEYLAGFFTAYFMHERDTSERARQLEFNTATPFTGLEVWLKIKV